MINQQGLGEVFDLEFLIIDDCSADDTCSIIEEYELAYTQFTANSGGPNKGRNLGLRKARGSFICIADQDDEWQPDRIRTLLNYTHKADIISSGHTLKDSRTNLNMLRSKTCPDGFIFYETNTTFRTQLCREKQGQNCYLGGLLYSAKLKDIEFEEEYGMVDYDWYLRLFEERASLEVCKSLYTRHVEGSNLSLNEEYRKRDFEYSLQTIDSLAQKYPRLVPYARRSIQGSRARYFYLIGNMKKARHHFMKSHFSLKTIFYYLSSYYGHKWVRRKYNVFG
jgi:glycosyltransferase involved in cell wall biosynthesis